MVSNSTTLFKYTAELITINIGLLALICGILGNILNIIIFTSLKTFRETSTAFYLTCASFVNIIHLFANLFSRILITGYNIDLTQTSSTICELRQYIAVIAPLMSVSCMCFTAIDQFASLTIRWRHFSQRYIAWRLVIVTFIFWYLVNIPVIIYHKSYYSSATGLWSCSIINMDYSLYYSRFYVSFLLGFIQLTIRISFGLLAFLNVRSLANRQTPIIRLQRDKQITSMVLIEVVVDVILSLPLYIYYTYTTYVLPKDLEGYSVYQLIITITTISNYITFGIGFYIYCCSSSRFRSQLIYVFVGIHSKHWRKTNTIMPDTQVNA